MNDLKLRRRYEELIQVAAVAVANAEIERFGKSMADAPGDPYGGTTQAEQVLADVLAERQAQDRTWGIQVGFPVERFLILMEEVGEVAEEIPIPGPMDTRIPGDYVVERAREVGQRAKRILETR